MEGPVGRTAAGTVTSQRNPKSETRNPKQIQIDNEQGSKQNPAACISARIVRSVFEFMDSINSNLFRISDFGF
jgi:hypothetical protein